MIPLSAVWAGPARDEHFKAPPLFFGKTEGSTPFRRYRNSQIFAFDFGGSIRTAALAMAGDWHDLGCEFSVGSERRSAR